MPGIKLLRALLLACYGYRYCEYVWQTFELQLNHHNYSSNGALTLCHTYSLYPLYSLYAPCANAHSVKYFLVPQESHIPYGLRGITCGT